LVIPEELAASFNITVGISVKNINEKDIKIVNLDPVTIHSSKLTKNNTIV
jgi:hypothetical protein